MPQDSDAWTRFAHAFGNGEVIAVRITRVLAYGAEAEVIGYEGVYGLIHVSELSEQRVGDPHDVVSEHEVVHARIAKIDAPRRKLGLSLRASR